jgi:hypothetical protein
MGAGSVHRSFPGAVRAAAGSGVEPDPGHRLAALAGQCLRAAAEPRHEPDHEQRAGGRSPSPARVRTKPARRSRSALPRGRLGDRDLVRGGTDARGEEISGHLDRPRGVPLDAARHWLVVEDAGVGLVVRLVPAVLPSTLAAASSPWRAVPRWWPTGAGPCRRWWGAAYVETSRNQRNHLITHRIQGTAVSDAHRARRPNLRIPYWIAVRTCSTGSATAAHVTRTAPRRGRHGRQA